MLSTYSCFYFLEIYFSKTVLICPTLTVRIFVCQSDDDSDDSDDEDYTPPEETALESYTTPLDTDDYAIDEYVTFKEVLLGM